MTAAPKGFKIFVPDAAIRVERFISISSNGAMLPSAGLTARLNCDCVDLYFDEATSQIGIHPNNSGCFQLNHSSKKKPQTSYRRINGFLFCKEFGIVKQTRVPVQFDYETQMWVTEPVKRGDRTRSKNGSIDRLMARAGSV